MRVSDLLCVWFADVDWFAHSGARRQVHSPCIGPARTMKHTPNYVPLHVRPAEWCLWHLSVLATTHPSVCPSKQSGHQFAKRRGPLQQTVLRSLDIRAIPHMQRTKLPDTSQVALYVQHSKIRGAGFPDVPDICQVTLQTKQN